MLVALVALLFGVVVLIGILRNVRWPSLALLSAVPLGLFAFLVDDTSPQRGADLGPRAGPDDPVFAVAMWLSDTPEFSRLSEMKIPPDSEAHRLPKEPSEWREYVTQHRGGIEQAWIDHALCREWITLLSTLESERVWPVGADTPLLNYKAVRELMHCVLLKALAAAYDGRPDDALAEITALIQATQTLQRSAPTLVNQMICNVVMRQALAVASEVVQSGNVSEAAKGALRDVLTDAPSMDRLFRNTFEGEVDFSMSVLANARDGNEAPRSVKPDADRYIALGMRYLGPLVFNYHRTVADLNGTFRDIQRLSSAREMEELGRLQPRCATGLQRFKNPVGRLLSAMMLPTFEKIVQHLWAVEDSRTGLLEWLKASAPST